MGTWRTVRGWHGPLAWLAALAALVAAGSAVGVAVDDRLVTGQPAWLKPFKFGVSFVAYAPTLAWATSHLGRWRRPAWWAGTAIAVAGVAELVLLVTQAARGRASHFNVGTELDAVIFRAMGGFVAVIFLAALVIAATLPAARIGDRAMTLAVRLGATVSVIGLSVGVLMLGETDAQSAARAAGAPTGLSGAHSVGVVDGGPGLPLVGWSTTGGDLRVGHFVGMHALQALPLLALLLVRTGLDERRRARLVAVAAAGYLGLVVLVVWQALRGQPLVAPDASTVLAAAALALATAVLAAVVVRRTPRAAVAS